MKTNNIDFNVRTNKGTDHKVGVSGTPMSPVIDLAAGPVVNAKEAIDNVINAGGPINPPSDMPIIGMDLASDPSEGGTGVTIQGGPVFYDEVAFGQPDNATAVDVVDDQAAKVLAELESRIASFTLDQIEVMDEATMDGILGETFIADIKNTVGPEKVSAFKRDFLKYLKQQESVKDTIDTFNKEMAEVKAKFNDDMNNLMNTLDHVKTLAELEDRIKNTEDEEAKAVLVGTYTQLHNSLYLSNLVDRINNKGAEVLKKEAKKSFKDTEKKFVKIIKNDKKMYLPPTNLEMKLLNIVKPENRSGIETFLYVLYRTITKNKQVEVQTNLFINYFIMNVDKSIKLREEEWDENMQLFVKSVNDVVALVK